MICRHLDSSDPAMVFVDTSGIAVNASFDF
jgi:hypothetical protein